MHLPRALLSSLCVQHRALVKATLGMLRHCDVTSLDLSRCKGVSDDWLPPMADKHLTDLNLSGCTSVSFSEENAHRRTRDSGVLQVKKGPSGQRCLGCASTGRRLTFVDTVWLCWVGAVDGRGGVAAQGPPTPAQRELQGLPRTAVCTTMQCFFCQALSASQSYNVGCPFLSPFNERIFTRHLCET